jgi:hypothetical protein
MIIPYRAIAFSFSFAIDSSSTSYQRKGHDRMAQLRRPGISIPIMTPGTFPRNLMNKIDMKETSRYSMKDTRTLVIRLYIVILDSKHA